MAHIVERLLGDDITMTSNLFKLLPILIETDISSFCADVCRGTPMKLVKTTFPNELRCCDPRGINCAAKNIQIDKSATGQVKSFIRAALLFK
jgi:hypothetical protein